MENASKALIIAGAILLSILIIGLGMGAFKNASSTSGNADLSSTEVAAHNATFEAYEGRTKGKDVKTLLNAIKKNNSNYEDRQIKVDGQGVDDDGEIDVNSIKTSTTYEVSFTYDGNDGFIDTCTISIYGATE